MKMMTAPVTAKRPRILVRAARIASSEFKREKDLCRVLGTSKLPKPGRALDSLFDIEGRLDAERREEAAGYNARKHIFVLAALMTELRFCRSGSRPDLT